MSNMGYCRFRNTNGDLQDCLNVMRDANSIEELDLSKEELAALGDMLGNCQEFIDLADILLNKSEGEGD